MNKFIKQFHLYNTGTKQTHPGRRDRKKQEMSKQLNVIQTESKTIFITHVYTNIYYFFPAITVL